MQNPIPRQVFSPDSASTSSGRPSNFSRRRMTGRTAEQPYDGPNFTFLGSNIYS